MKRNRATFLFGASGSRSVRTMRQSFPQRTIFRLTFWEMSQKIMLLYFATLFGLPFQFGGFGPIRIASIGPFSESLSICSLSLRAQMKILPTANQVRKLSTMTRDLLLSEGLDSPNQEDRHNVLLWTGPYMGEPSPRRIPPPRACARVHVQAWSLVAFAHRCSSHNSHRTTRDAGVRHRPIQDTNLIPGRTKPEMYPEEDWRTSVDPNYCTGSLSETRNPSWRFSLILDVLWSSICSGKKQHLT
jgi:hypothetical protein